MLAPTTYSRRASSRRWASAFLGALYLFALASPLAHAALESPLGSVAHVEAEGAKGCYQTHDHRYCQLCRLNLVPAAPSSGAEFIPRPVHAGDLAATSSNLEAAPPLLPGQGPRAPPLS